MEIAVIADVHSNLPALEAVLDEIGDMEVFCCGDVVGYYPFPNETVEIFKKRGIKAVMGNHDYSVVSGKTSSLNYSAAFAAKWTIDVISDPNLKYLNDLSESFKGKDFSAFHGSPRDPLLEYVYPDYPAETLKNYLGESKVLILGHTHVPFEKHYEEGIVLNPGSVGQPRDGSPRASFAVLNVELGEVRIERTDYEIEKVADKVIKEGFPENLAERLFYGF